MILKKQGYTFIELVIVLTILTAMIATVTISFQPLSATKTIDHFIERLEEDIYYAQSLALSRKKTIRFQFAPNDHLYRIRGHVPEVFLERNYSEAITVTKGSMGYEFTFNQKGNINQAGTLLVETKKGKYKLIFQLGEGRFDVQKL